ncbi:inositol polyphosphate multikinase [Thalassophryne amazonica]|uniref:inositol polyphosphate multikinase n=1 Tax=Thalassophryne amazonica TaxID=390379 RepID=UPI001471061C|nr:inositol polyphosphate multikinase [Thalassophryne amazonica]
MSTAGHHVMMESSLAHGGLDLNPSPAPLGISLNPRPPGGPPDKDKLSQRPVGPPAPAHLIGCVPLSHQVAGHKYGVDKVGILQHPDGTVLKQLQPPPRGLREMQFYSMVYAEDCSDPCLLALQNHLPKYYGTWCSPDSSDDMYLKLEDVTRRFAKPCIMDVKLGQRSYDPFASQEKREQQIKKYPLMEEIGFLVLGLRVYKVCSDSFDTYDQHYGRRLDQDTVKDGLAKFFHNGVCLRKDALSASIHRVQHILRWFQSQRQLNFYASSLLFVYEGLTSSLSFLSEPVGNIVSLSSSAESGEEADKNQGDMAGQEEDVAEYNNNNIHVAVPWDSSLTSIYTNYRKTGPHHCLTQHLCTNGVGDHDAMATTNSGSGDNISTVCEEDNLAWKWTHVSRQQQPPNRNDFQLEVKNKGERDSSSGRKETDDRGSGVAERKTGGGEAEVRMIDFAHVFPSDSHDHGYIYGLQSLLGVLEQILRDAA